VSPSDAAIRQAWSEYLTQPDRALYDETGNGIHVWVAYRRARRVGGLPGWILAYFDKVGGRVTAPGGTVTAKAIAAAFGLQTIRGGHSARTRAIDERKAQAVRQRLRLAHTLTHAYHRPQPIETAIARVAEQFGLSESRVRKILYPPRKKARLLRK